MGKKYAGMFWQWEGGNKTELFNFLSRALLDAVSQEEKQLITNDESILSKPELNVFDSF